jgi:hypothetical protein
MTPVTVYDTGPLGDEPCPACRRLVYWAWDADMTPVALDPDENGTVAVSLDGNSLPWCREARGSQLAFDESLHRLHDPNCTGLATVTPIGQARSRRTAPRRTGRPETARRTAHAR